MARDIVEALREHAGWDHEAPSTCAKMRAAADALEARDAEIKRLRAERDDLRAGVEEQADWLRGQPRHNQCPYLDLGLLAARRLIFLLQDTAPSATSATEEAE